MSTITDEQVEAAIRAIAPPFYISATAMRRALTAAALGGKPLPIPKSFHWLGDREAAEITLHATDVRGCVAYFDRQSDCLEFMRQVTNSATAYEAETVEPPLPRPEPVYGAIDVLRCGPAPATPGRADDWQGKVDTAMDLYELATSPSPPAQGEHSVQAKRLEKELRDYVITGHNPDGPPPIRFHPRICSEAADRIATLTKELAAMTESRDDAFADHVRRNNDAADARIELSMAKSELAEAKSTIEEMKGNGMHLLHQLTQKYSELAEARKVMEIVSKEIKPIYSYYLNRRVIEPTREVTIALNAARDWLDRNKATGEAG